MRIFALILAGIATTIGLASITLPTQAQGFDEAGLAVKPAIIDINGKPGETVKTTIALQNISRDSLGIAIDSRGLVPNDPEIDQSRRSEFDASLWIDPVQSATILDGGQQKDIPININIPDSASPGGHYALITFRASSTEREQNDDASSTKTNTEVTTVALITVPGEIQEQAEIALRAFPTISFNSGQDINVLFSNTGNIHVLPRARVSIYTHDGKVLETMTIPAELVLPNTIKTLTTSWDPSGEYGRFYVEVSIDFGSPGQTLTVQSGTLWVLPTLPTLALWTSLFTAVVFTLLTAWRWPDAARKAAAHPIRFVRRKTLREAREDQSVNKQKTLKKVSVKDPALDDLGKQRDIPNIKKRSIDGVLTAPKQAAKPTILNDTQRTSEATYLKEIEKKPAHTQPKIQKQIKDRLRRTNKDK